MRRMTVERHYTRLPERLGAGKSKTRAACHGGGAKKAVAAMTCPGVPTHRKRLRPAERVETESAYIGSLPSVEAGRLCRAITTSAIPLKTTLRVANHDVAAKTRV